MVNIYAMAMKNKIINLGINIHFYTMNLFFHYNFRLIIDRFNKILVYIIIGESKMFLYVCLFVNIPVQSVADLIMIIVPNVMEMGIFYKILSVCAKIIIIEDNHVKYALKTVNSAKVMKIVLVIVLKILTGYLKELVNAQ